MRSSAGPFVYLGSWEKYYYQTFFFFPLRGQSSCLFLCSGLKKKKRWKGSFSGGICNWIAEEEACMPGMAGLLIEIILRKPLLTLLCSRCPPGLLSMPPLWAFTEGTRNHGSRAGSEVSIFFKHPCWALRLQCLPHAVIISYNWKAHCIYRDSTWITLWDSYKVLVKPMGQIVLPSTHGKGYGEKKAIYSASKIWW